VFDVAKLTLDEVEEEIGKTLDKLERLQTLYAAMQAQDHRRVKKLIEEYNAAKRKGEETSTTISLDTKNEPDSSAKSSSESSKPLE
jgi:hypothetical protein